MLSYFRPLSGQYPNVFLIVSGFCLVFVPKLLLIAITLNTSVLWRYLGHTNKSITAFMDTTFSILSSHTFGWAVFAVQLIGVTIIIRTVYKIVRRERVSESQPIVHISQD